MESFAGKICIVGATLLAGCAFAVQGAHVTATIYVGRHFEVRDHDQATKYVFNGATRVAEVTGSLSANLRVQRLRLYPGWNLCSLAVSGPFPASDAEVISAAYQWNQITGGYSPVSLGQTLSAGTVLWLKANADAILSILGAYTDPAPQMLPVGGAYVAGAGLEVWSPPLPDSVSAWEFDSSASQWSDHLTGSLAVVSGPPPTVSPGQAVYLEATGPVSLATPDPALRIRYYHEDHLGSSAAITDARGNLIEETAFYPFGISRNKYRPRQVEEHYEFTQKERDRESGLNYFEARYLTAELSRFATVDSKYADPGELSSEEFGSFLSDPQEMNLYGYVRNGPLTHVDPTGLSYCDMEPYADDCREGQPPEERPSVGQQVQVLGGMLEAGAGGALCETIIGCVIGGPMAAHGVDNMQAGIRGTPTLTAQYLGPKVDLAMNVLPIVVGGVNLIRGLASGGATLAAKADTLVADVGNAATVSPVGAAKTWPASAVAKTAPPAPPAPPASPAATAITGDINAARVESARLATIRAHNEYVISRVQAYTRANGAGAPLPLLEVWAREADALFYGAKWPAH
jgi:RHS repeat-associated protein